MNSDVWIFIFIISFLPVVLFILKKNEKHLRDKMLAYEQARNGLFNETVSIKEIEIESKE